MVVHSSSTMWTSKVIPRACTRNILLSGFLVSAFVVMHTNYVASPFMIKTYDPKECLNMINGHCDDVNGGAWSYKDEQTGACTGTEDNVPRDFGAANGLADLFQDVTSVMDFGGGLGPYLLSFRDKGVTPLVIMEPISFGDCLFRGMTQDTTDVINTDLKHLPKEQFDLVMTIEVVEHIPVEFHSHIIDALVQASKKYILFSAAHPGQDGEGHVGPSMKTRNEWVNEITSRHPQFKVDTELSEKLYSFSGDLINSNAVVFRKQGV